MQMDNDTYMNKSFHPYADKRTSQLLHTQAVRIKEGIKTSLYTGGLVLGIKTSPIKKAAPLFLSSGSAAVPRMPAHVPSEADDVGVCLITAELGYSDSSAASNDVQVSATHCNTLQHNAVQCNTMQHTATHCDAL